MSDSLTPFLAAVRERLKVCASDPSYNEHDDCHLDLARLLALVTAGEEMVTALEKIRTIEYQASVLATVYEALHRCEVLALDALTRYHAAVQEATRETGHNTGGHDE